VERFIIDKTSCTVGFQEYVGINLLRPITDETLRRRRLYPRVAVNDGNPHDIRKIITHNSSLRVNFGWSFESSDHYNKIMNECIKEVVPKFNEHTGYMMSDMTCAWLGFIPHNSYDVEVYKDLSTYSLILFNNEMIDFQLSVVKFLANHLTYRQHALLRDDQYRFNFFKAFRKDRENLSEAYRFYMNAIKDISAINAISRDLLEEQIGCHFLHAPDLFFELVNFSILKGELYD